VQQELLPEPLAYQGFKLAVPESMHARLSQLFCDVDVMREYRLADSWLIIAPRSKRPRKKMRFLVNWMRKVANRQAQDMQKEAAVRAEANVGAGPDFHSSGISARMLARELARNQREAALDRERYERRQKKSSTGS